MHLPGEERQQGRQAAVPVPAVQLRRRAGQDERQRPQAVAAQGRGPGQAGGRAPASAHRLHGRRHIQPVRGQDGAVRPQVRAKGQRRAVCRPSDTDTDRRPGPRLLRVRLRRGRGRRKRWRRRWRCHRR